MLDQEATRSAVSLISGKWTLRVLAELANGPRSYNALATATRLDNKALSRSLRAMEETGLVVRNARTERPVRTRYDLTASARSLLDLLDALAIWRRETLCHRPDPTGGPVS